MSKYFFIFRLAFVRSFRNYKALVGHSLFLLTCLIVFAHVWKLAAAKLGISHLRPEQLLWYIALNEWVLISIPDVQVDMEQDLRSGKLTYLLPRPVSYLGTVFFEGLGLLFANLLVLGFVSFLFAEYYSSFHFPHLPIFILLGILSGIVAVLFQMLVGMSAFWIQEVTPFNWIWEKLLFAFGGLLLPLSAYPLWLQKIAACTPFPAILGQRSALVLNFSSTEILHLTATLLFWALFAILCLALLYRRGIKILNLEGG